MKRHHEASRTEGRTGKSRSLDKRVVCPPGFSYSYECSYSNGQTTSCSARERLF